MKKILLSFSALAAMLATTTTFSACSSDDSGQEQPTYSTLILDGVISSYTNDDEIGTRAISVDGDNLKTFWKTTDLVTVYSNQWQTKVGELHPQSDTESTATPTKTKLTGDVSHSSLKTGDELNLIYPRTDWQYTGQDGTWESISQKYDYATANVNIVYIDASDNNKVYATTASFGKAQQAIIRFTILDSNGDALALPEYPELTITAAGNQLVTKCSLDGTATEKGALVITKKTQTTTQDPNNVFYVAIRNNNENADQYTLTIKGKDNKMYTYTKKDITFAKGDFKKIKVKMKFQDDTYTERTAYDDKGEETWE